MRANTPPDSKSESGCRLIGLKAPVLSERGPTEGQGWAWLFTDAALSTSDIYKWGAPVGKEEVLTYREGIFCPIP